MRAKSESVPLMDERESMKWKWKWVFMVFKGLTLGLG